MSKKNTLNLTGEVTIECSSCPTKFIPKYGEYEIKHEGETQTGEVWVKHFILGFECPVCHEETEIGYWGGVKN